MMFRISPKNIRDLSVNFFEAKVKTMKTRIKTPPPLKYNILFEKLKDITTPEFLIPKLQPRTFQSQTLTPDFSTMKSSARDFSTLNLVLKLGVETFGPLGPSCTTFQPQASTKFGVEGFMVEKSGVEVEIHRQMVDWPNFQNGFAVLTLN
jgi:hypothetical protein